ncbi:MAG: cytochrome c [Saprospiraceae bacterium]|nr:cytochrome c [Saprospiraceae bacterium]
MKKIFALFLAAGLFVILSGFYNDGDPWDVPAKYKSMKNPTSADDGDCKDVGKSLYDKHCKSCHGSEGFGDGKKAGEIDTPMPDLTTDDFKKEVDGVKYYQSFIGRKDMPNFEKKITSEEDRWCVINYINAL